MKDEGTSQGARGKKSSPLENHRKYSNRRTNGKVEWLELVQEQYAMWMTMRTKGRTPLARTSMTSLNIERA